jgi:hypothetical protein
MYENDPLLPNRPQKPTLGAPIRRHSHVWNLMSKHSAKHHPNAKQRNPNKCQCDCTEPTTHNRISLPAYGL